MELERLEDLVTDGYDGVEAGHRVLKDHGDLVAANLAHVGFFEGQEVLTFKDDAALVMWPISWEAGEGC